MILMSYELIITEKPSSAEKIATALADSKPKKISAGQVSYYELTHNGKSIKVASAVGHLFTVVEKDKKEGWTYPIFDLKWELSSKANKAADYTEKYVKVLKDLSKGADEFTVATDYDIEGEVIGLNIVLYICKKKDANRMKFSTLTKGDLVKSYENKAKTLNWGQAKAGATRHELDWLYGINLSRALTLAIKQTGTFKILSSGRVQGPALKILVDKEKEIEKFIPVDYWQLQLDGLAKKEKILADYEEEKIFDKKKADDIFEKTKHAKKATVSNVESKQFKQAPPTPFDLTTLQMEAHRTHRISPKDALATAQELYVAGYISYPRTSSQKLPKELGLKGLVSALAKQKEYAALVTKLLSKSELKPNEGDKTDDAHPSIYPTGEVPAKLSEYQAKIYDLIVRRFLATFATEATRETMTVDLDVNSYKFITKGTRTVEKGWHEFYGPYAVFEEVTLPALQKNDIIDVLEITCETKQTKPPKRYTAASIIKELEKRGLGTKATRATIVENLFDRGYVSEKSIQATKLGIRTCDTLTEYAPRILDEDLTRQFEDKMEAIRTKELTPTQVLDEAKETLTDILTDFKKKEKEIGKSLLSAEKESRDIATIIGDCPSCVDGKLKIMKGKFGWFIACNTYPECKTTFKIPHMGMPKPCDDKCTHCQSPQVLIVKRAKQPEKFCINPDCPGKAQVKEGAKVPGEGATCEKCGTGIMMLRRGPYGQFLGCSGYPKCRNLKQIPKSALEASPSLEADEAKPPLIVPIAPKDKAVAPKAKKKTAKK
jgi:DNA topoisomerase I